jgi:shikimate kinase
VAGAIGGWRRSYDAGVKRVLLTGMSGTGKSTVISELAARGYKAIDTDYGGWSKLAELPANVPSGSGVAGDQDWLWREDRMARLLATDDAEILFVSGATLNQSKFYGLFDHIVLLTAPVEVITERLARRTSNPYGKRPGELDCVLALKKTVEPLLRRAADLEVDTSVPLEQVVAKILEIVRGSQGRKLPPVRS